MLLQIKDTPDWGEGEVSMTLDLECFRDLSNISAINPEKQLRLVSSGKNSLDGILVTYSSEIDVTFI
jgi:hypothetical protein